MTFLSPILMVGMVVLIAYLTQLNDNEKRIIGVFNESIYFSEDFKSDDETGYAHLKNTNLNAAIDSTLTMGYYGLLHIPSKTSIEEASKHAYFYSKEAASLSSLKEIELVFEERLRDEKLRQLGVSKQEFEHIGDAFEINTSTFSGEENLKGISELKASIGGIFGYLIMMFIIIYGGFVMRSVIEEKTSRIIEVIISSVRPFQLMMGKIIGTAFAGVTQFIIWIISGGILLLIAFAVFDIDPSVLNSTTEITSTMNLPGGVSMPAESNELLGGYLQEFFKLPLLMLVIFFLIYFVLGYLIYSSIYAAIGAAVDNETDTQQFIFPIILPLMLAIYVGFFSVFSNPHGPIAVGFSLFPLTSPIVMLMRLPNGIGEGGVPLWQLITSILLLIATFIAIVWLAAKIYRIGILMYGKKPTYKELFKWLRY